MFIYLFILLFICLFYLFISLFMYFLEGKYKFLAASGKERPRTVTISIK